MGGGEGDGAGPDAGGEHADGEAGAFFVGPVDDADREVRLHFIVVEDAQHFYAGADAEDAVLGLYELGVSNRSRGRR